MNSLAYKIEGPEHAPAVVLLHSIATDCSLWRLQAPIWSQQSRLISIDLPGHGLSVEIGDRPSLDEFSHVLKLTLDELRVERATFVGLSLGGMVAQAFALAHPQRVRSLVLAHTSAQTPEKGRQIWASRLSTLEEQGMEGQVQGTLARWFTTEFAVAAPLTLEWIANSIRRTSQTGYAAAVHAIQGLDYLDRLSTIIAPTLVLAGAQDTAAPPTLASAIAQRLPHAELHIFDHCAHLGNVEQAAAFTERVGAFLVSTRAR